MYPLSTSGFGGLFFKECLSLTAALFSWDKSFWLPSWILAHEGDYCFKPSGSASWVFCHGFAKHLSQTEHIWTLKKYNHFRNRSAPSWSHFGFFHRGHFSCHFLAVYFLRDTLHRITLMTFLCLLHVGKNNGPHCYSCFENWDPQ